MQNSIFYNELAQYINNNDINKANSLIMSELANIMLKHRQDFISILTNANIIVPKDASDNVLVNTFVENAPVNRKLLLGASFLISHYNTSINADGECEISDAGTKALHKVMYNYFDCSRFDDQSDIVVGGFSDAGGWGAAAATALGIAKGLIDKNREKKNAGTTAKQGNAQAQMMQQLAIANAQKEAKAKEDAEKSKKTLIIAGVVVGVILLSIGGYFLLRKKAPVKMCNGGLI